MCECKEVYNDVTENICEEVKTYDDNGTCKYDLTQRQEEFCCKLTNYTEVYGRCIVCMCGLVFNAMAVFLFSNKKLSNVFFNRLLLCLVIVDSVYIILGIAEIWIITTPNFNALFAFFFIVKPVRDSTMCCAIYMTVLLAFERYRAVGKLSFNRIHNSTTVSWLKVIKLVGPVILFSILFKLPSFGEITIETIKERNDSNNTNSSSIVLSEKLLNDDGVFSTTTRIIVSTWRQNHLYVMLYKTIANIIVTGPLPLVLLSYFNFYIYKNRQIFLERRRTLFDSRREHRTTNNEAYQTITLFAIVITFVSCHILRIILDIYNWINHETQFDELGKGCRYGEQYWALLVAPISELLLRINSSINFFIYWAFNTSFRSVIYSHMLRLFSLCGISKCTNQEARSSNTEDNELQVMKTT